MVLVGLVVALSGIWSVRVAVMAAGAGAAWLLADAFGAGLATGLLAAASGAVLAFLTALLASKVLFFVFGAAIGAVVGARLFVQLDQGEASVLLAVVFVPAVAGCFGVLAGRWRQRFLGWATAVAGAALVISGLGRLAPDTLGALADPTTAAGQAAAAAAWVALAVLARWAHAPPERGMTAPTPAPRLGATATEGIGWAR
jgi:hypothetical protein